jgi:hypothetical protein
LRFQFSDDTHFSFAAFRTTADVNTWDLRDVTEKSCNLKNVLLLPHDIDLAMKNVIVRAGKGDKDRDATFPSNLTPLIRNHLVTQ